MSNSSQSVFVLSFLERFVFELFSAQAQKNRKMSQRRVLVRLHQSSFPLSVARCESVAAAVRAHAGLFVCFVLFVC